MGLHVGGERLGQLVVGIVGVSRGQRRQTSGELKHRQESLAAGWPQLRLNGRDDGVSCCGLSAKSQGGSARYISHQGVADVARFFSKRTRLGGCRERELRVPDQNGRPCLAGQCPCEGAEPTLAS
jgi:hypothetical protein